MPEPIRSFGYLGWTGFANMGDEAIHQAIAGAVPEVELVPVPLGPVGLLRAAGRLRALRRSPLLLGGGTVVGRRIWRLHLHQALALSARVPPHMIGVGVEDPSFARAGHLSDRGELARWRPLLGRFERVTVRGPRSSALLADAGVDARVVGDPALLLDPTDTGSALPLPPPDPDLIGINLGTSDDLWGHDQEGVVAATAVAAARLGRRGWRVRFLVVNPHDRRDAERCVDWSGLPPEQWEVVDAADPHEFLRAVQSCQLLVAERLHAGILAARAGVPAVMLEYQPKCRDFAESVGVDQYVIRTDRVSAGAVHETVNNMLAALPAVRIVVAERVAALRSLLATEISQLERVSA